MTMKTVELEVHLSRVADDYSNEGYMHTVALYGLLSGMYTHLDAVKVKFQYDDTAAMKAELEALDKAEQAFQAETFAHLQQLKDRREKLLCLTYNPEVTA